MHREWNAELLKYQAHCPSMFYYALTCSLRSNIFVLPLLLWVYPILITLRPSIITVAIWEVPSLTLYLTKGCSLSDSQHQCPVLRKGFLWRHHIINFILSLPQVLFTTFHLFNCNLLKLTVIYNVYSLPLFCCICVVWGFLIWWV